ncbi:hypothetical protein KIH79_03105 [Bifidobacterium sp. 82T10]|uniref:Anti-sigma factor n=1 Tax=Bifidobacterium miconis TaxID=2834435 RepID=A0ABS6WF89_9BIFI|nr:hypothetical protein [Bifidobacterium miconis]MBW3091957.1 hypothetical protein [Bifidobacterium miconis]
MSERIERHSHIAVTRQTVDGTIVRTDVHVAETGISPDALAGAGDPGEPTASPASGDACFDPNTCCDERERAIIMSLRAYLRPDVAPECLMRRLRETLDHCCCDQDE